MVSVAIILPPNIAFVDEDVYSEKNHPAESQSLVDEEKNCPYYNIKRPSHGVNHFFNSRHAIRFASYSLPDDRPVGAHKSQADSQVTQDVFRQKGQLRCSLCRSTSLKEEVMPELFHRS